MVILAVAVLSSLSVASCFRVQSSQGGGQAIYDAPRTVKTADVAVPRGYEVSIVAIGLTYPTDLAFDAQGRPYVIEAGYSYGDAGGEPRLLRIESLRRHTEIAVGKGGPWNGVDYHAGAFYVAGGHEVDGKVLRISEEGQIDEIVSGLPSLGDHHTNGPVVRDGWIYFGQGTATNSAVVGPDNFDFGWVQKHPDFHDVPCRDIELVPRTFESEDPTTPDPDDVVETGAYQPFGTTGRSGETIEGELPCTGSVMRVRLDGSDLQLFAWGLRNPFGLAFDAGGALYVTENQADVRGSRPVFGTGDLLWKIEEGNWYGWPDFYAGKPLTERHFAPPGETAPGFVLAKHPPKSSHPSAILGVHSSSNGFDFSRSSKFGYEGEAFIAQFGDMAPNVGKVLGPVGFKVVRVDPESGVINDFMVNIGETNGPASYLKTGGLERPISAVFGPDGTDLYVVDFGVMTTSGGKPQPKPATGAVWRISRTSEKSQ